MRKAGSDGIVKAALRVIGRDGAGLATMRRIAQEAGVTEAAIYRHFSGKDELISRLFALCADLLYDFLARRAAGIDDPKRRLGELAAAFFDFAFEHPDEYSLIVAVHNRQLRPLVEAGQRLPRDLFVDAIAQCQRQRGCQAVPAGLAAGAVIGAVMGTVLMVKHGGVEASRQAGREFVGGVAEALCEAVCAGALRAGTAGDHRQGGRQRPDDAGRGPRAGG